MTKKYSKISFNYKGRKVLFLKDGQKADYITEKIESEKTFYESDLLAWLTEQKIPVGDFVDVGANIGNHTLFFTKIMKRTTWSFEPYSKAYSLLKQNLAANDVDSSLCFPFGLSSKSAKANIVLPSGNNIGAARVDIDNASGDIELKKGDIVLADAKQIALMKIDVEGHELDVLKGCSKTIDKHKPLLLIECMNMNEYRKISDYLDAKQYLPIAVFGATPMLVFEYSKDPSGGMKSAVSQILERYFNLDDRFNKAREFAMQHNDIIIEVKKLREDNKSLLRKSAELEKAQKKYAYMKSEYAKIQDSAAYKLGLTITKPVRKAKKIIGK